MGKHSKDTLKSLYETMLRIRIFEEKIVELYPAQEMKTPVHLYIGQEAIASAVCAHLGKDDYVISNHRSHGHCIAKGMELRPIMAELYGRGPGWYRRQGGGLHQGVTKRGIPGTSAIVGGGIPMGVGTALASRIRKDGRVTVIFFGDGASEEGVFHESANLAALKKLPVVFMCENNFYATNSPQKARNATCEIAGRAASYGMAGLCVDGGDVLAVFDAAEEAVKRARDGGGPTLIEATAYRWKGHVGPDEDHTKGCRPEGELREWQEKCPVKLFTKYLLDESVMDDGEVKAMVDSITKEVDDSVEYALSLPYPDVSALTEDLYYTEAGQPDSGKV